jgi:predicted Zn-dependent protease
MNETAALHGEYYDGRQPIGRAATLYVIGREATLTGSETTLRFSLGDLRVSPQVASAPRFVSLPDGGQFLCPDDLLLRMLPQEVPSEGPVAWLEKTLIVAIACDVLIAVMVLAGYFYGLPIVARHIAARIPIATEKALGEQALAWLDTQDWFRPSAVAPERQASIRSGFTTLTHGLPFEPSYRLEFRASPRIGANAFALPGGAIVITDDMVNLAQSDDEALAILAHEVGHVELRHTMRNLLQSSAAAVIAGAVTADAASLSLAVTGAPLILMQARYSRELEAEADDFAFERLKQTGRSPESFAVIMEKIAASTDADKPHFADFLSTHPVTAERIARARAASVAPASAPVAAH